MLIPPTKILSPEQAILLVQSHQNIVTAHVSAEPRHFFELLASRIPNIVNTKVYCANPSQDYPCFQNSDWAENTTFEMMFLNPHVRQKHRRAQINYAPCHMSQWASFILRSIHARQQLGLSSHASEFEDFAWRDKPIDIFWGSCTLPDDTGRVSLGLNSCYEPELLKRSKCVILEMNPLMPYTFGSTEINIDDVDYFVPQNKPMPSHLSPDPSAEDRRIGNYVAELVSNGSTIQLGIGSIPNAIGQALCGHRHLGVHTEMINDAIMSLAQAGAIDGSQKTLWPGKTIGAFVYGSQDLYKFVNRNPSIELYHASKVNDRATIAKNYKMTSINTAVEIDLTGQVCSESIGHGQITGVGGASDTHVGAQLSPGGRGIVALRSTTKDGNTSKIVSTLAAGAKVSISRNDIDTVITEFGVATLSGKNIRDRVRTLIGIAHPKFREQLTHEAQNEGYI